MTNARAADQDADRPVSTFRIGAVRGGDVIFLSSRPRRWRDRLGKAFNVYGQRVLAAIRRVERVDLFMGLPHHSHVLLGVGGGLVIHADGKRVSIDVISNVIGHAVSDEATFKVYRRTDLSPALAQAAVKAAYRYYDQSYGFLRYFGAQTDTPRRSEDTTQFCSRLVAHAYRSVGMTLTELPDARVLPVDLYLICLGEPWQNVTEEFVELTANHTAVEHLLKDIGFTDETGKSWVDLVGELDQSMQRAAEIQKEIFQLQHKSVRDTLQAEGQLGNLVGLELQLALALRKSPKLVDEKDVAQICRLLEQLPALLGYAELPDLELIVPPPSGLYSGGDKADTAAFVGLPSGTVLHEMQLAREFAKLYSYFVFAEFGMLSIASRMSDDARFAAFRDVKPEHVARFVAAVPQMDTPESRLAIGENGFLWVKQEAFRDQFRQLSANIVKVLQLLDIVRTSQSKAAASM